ncbi:MAG: CHASE3 domain-containing protein [Verrucomicrobiae bacterium]|nr:CHASE3 domain-containing protein [Verrucomicrobiae bacterium]
MNFLCQIPTFEMLAVRMRAHRSQLYSALVAVWLTLSIAGVVMAAVSWVRLSESVNAAVAVSNFNDTLDRVFSLVLEAESGQRGYTITGIESFLDPYELALQRLPGELEALTEFSLIDRERQRKVLDLRVLVELRLNQMLEVVQARRTQGFPAAALQIVTGNGEETMDQIRLQIGGMRRDRVGILTRHGATTRQHLNRANITSLVAGVLGVGAGFFAFFLARLSLDHERMERQLAESKLQAEKDSAQKSAFLANMSHEIRTPMNAILGFTDLLSAEVREPRQRRYLTSIRTASESLLQIINDVLDMSKIEAGVVDLHPEPTDPREICEFLHSVFSEQAARRSVQLTCGTAEDLPRALLLDRTRIRQVLVNLVGNAVKFTERGFIRVHIMSEAQAAVGSRITLVIEVEDTGIGIPKDRLDDVFKPFAQTDPRRPQEQEGTGLGLAIVRRLIELMGGTVAVASIEGHGTTFRVRIPDVAVSARLPATQLPASNAAVDFNEFRPATLVVADDNAVNRELIESIFSPTHHALHFGVNGEEALALARALKPDAVLLDIRMPLLDGRETLAAIRQSPGLELVPVVAVTASNLADDEREFREEFDGYVRKPFTPRALFEELAQFLPRAEVPTAAAGSEPLPPTTQPPGGAPTLQRAELAVELHRLESSDWPTVRDGMSMTEVHDFAARLRGLGEDAECAPLVDYAGVLESHAMAYDISALEPELARFPQLISQLEANTV